MKDKDKLQQNLITLLKSFKNRSYHLAKYLLDNDALSDSFMKKISKKELKLLKNDIIFKDIHQMNDYYNSLIETDREKEKTKEEIIIELNDKLDCLIKEEKYEEAIYIRDYMIKNNIPRFNF
jgi:predicted ATPase